MTYLLIGTGNMAHFLALRLSLAGWQCVGVFGRNVAKAQHLAASLQAPAIIELSAVPTTASACILAVSDSAIASVAAQLPALTQTVLIHTSGAASLDEIKHPLKACLWPIYSIVSKDFPNHRQIPIIYECNSENARIIVESLAKSISDKVEATTHEKRLQLHLVAAISNNFINHILAIAKQYCTEHALDFSLFQPILQQTFERAITQNPITTQTGAAKRNDTATMQKHIQLLQEYPQWQQLYKIISQSIKDMYSTIG